MGIGAYSPKHYGGEPLDSIDLTVSGAIEDAEERIHDVLQRVGFAKCPAYTLEIVGHGNDLGVSITIAPEAARALIEERAFSPDAIASAAALSHTPESLNDFYERTITDLHTYFVESLIDEGLEPAYRTSANTSSNYSKGMGDSDLSVIRQSLAESLAGFEADYSQRVLAELEEPTTRAKMIQRYSLGNDPNGMVIPVIPVVTNNQICLLPIGRFHLWRDPDTTVLTLPASDALADITNEALSLADNDLTLLPGDLAMRLQKEVVNPIQDKGIYAWADGTCFLLVATPEEVPDICNNMDDSDFNFTFAEGFTKELCKLDFDGLKSLMQGCTPEWELEGEVYNLNLDDLQNRPAPKSGMSL